MVLAKKIGRSSKRKEKVRIRDIQI